MLCDLCLLYSILANCTAPDKQMCSDECHCMMHVFCADTLLLLTGIGTQAAEQAA